MVPFLKRVVSQENLELAWKKTKNCYRWGDVWYDELEVVNFELKLSENLELIGDDLLTLNYEMSPMKLIPQPKKPTSDVPYRQFFSIPIRDQVAWIAVVNILGPVIDSQMPRWSYGNRLYRSVWSEEDDRGKERIRIGSYRSYSGRLFATFQQSWPRFRREIYFTYRNMIRSKTNLGKRDQQAFENEISLPKNIQLAYLWNKYFKKSKGEVFYAGLDFKKFYPSINRDIIKSNLEKYFGHVTTSNSIKESETIGRLVKNMLIFPVDHREWLKNPFRLTDEELLNLDVCLEDKIYTGGLPTGLFVAGFLANVALLDVDKKVNTLLHYGQENYDHDVAHFRYVDDHIILSSSFDRLLEWKRQYEAIINKSHLDISINAEKTEPEPLRKYFEDPLDDAIKKSAIDKCRLDKNYPAPFMTKTLNIISDIADTHFELLDNKELEQLLSELEHLLMAEFPDSELKEDTRISFAAMKLSKLGSLLYFDSIETAEAKKEAKRLLTLLLKALEKNPEKLRIWKRTIEFCFLVGLEDIYKVTNLARKIYSKDKLRLCRYYIEAYIIQLLANQILTCVRLLASDNSLHTERQAAIRFMRSVFKLEIYKNNNHIMISYQKLSHDRLTISKSAALIVCPNINKELGWEMENLRSVLRKHSNDRIISLKNRKLKWYGNSKYEHSCWCVWVETRIGGLSSFEPSIFWEIIINLINPKEVGSWFLWRSYPRKLPDQLINSIIFKSNISWNTIRDAKSAGFLYDLLSSRLISKNELHIGWIDKNIVESVEIAFGEQNKNINLFYWCDWTRKEYLNSIHRETSKFDPRLSE